MSRQPGRIVLVTSNHLRHRWVAGQIAQAAELVAVVAEQKPADSPAQSVEVDPETRDYFNERAERERHWFGSVPDFESRAPRTLRVPWRGTNSSEAFDFVRASEPALVILFGCCIVRDPLLGEFDGRIVNMHLGLSPYYRGSATNFWPLVDGLPECVGVTIHHATPAVDGGEIIAQARPDAGEADGAHDLGCKANMAGTEILCRLAAAGRLPAGRPQEKGGKLCRRADYTVEALHTLQERLAGGMMAAYARNKPPRDGRFPIHSLPSMW